MAIAHCDPLHPTAAASMSDDTQFEHFKTATIEMITAQGGIVGWAAPLAALAAAFEAEEVPA